MIDRTEQIAQAKAEHEELERIANEHWDEFQREVGWTDRQIASLVKSNIASSLAVNAGALVKRLEAGQ